MRMKIPLGYGGRHAQFVQRSHEANTRQITQTGAEKLSVDERTLKNMRAQRNKTVRWPLASFKHTELMFSMYFFKVSTFGGALSRWESLLFSTLMKLSDIDLNCK